MEKTINRIKKFTNDRNWDQFHSGENLTKSIVIESAELLELFQWQNEIESIERLKEELADVLIYSIMLAEKYNLDIKEIINDKITLNEKKYPVIKAYGKKTKYNKL